MFQESAAESWKLRYGSELSESVFETKLLNHRSVKRYSDTPVSRQQVELLVAAAQSAATSSNLQSWSVISVQDPTKRQKIAAACGNQKQILTSPWFFVFLADLHRIESYATAAGMEPTALHTTEMFTVAVIDAALAAERMVCAAEEQGLGICYIGALRNHPDIIKNELNLPDLTFGVFGLCLGYPSGEADIKPRLRQDQIWFEESYPDTLDSSEYDGRMKEFYEKQGMDSSSSFAYKSGQRVTIEGLSGREKLLEHLHAQQLAAE